MEVGVRELALVKLSTNQASMPTVGICYLSVAMRPAGFGKGLTRMRSCKMRVVTKNTAKNILAFDARGRDCAQTCEAWSTTGEKKRDGEEKVRYTS